jgi:dihydroxyacid dehydratase/phosphogluconate dehydratase
MEAAAKEFAALGCMPFAACCTDPCDGRTQGTPGMMDSLAYRNDAASIFRRLIRSLPPRKGVLGVATCDKVPAGDDDGRWLRCTTCPSPLCRAE